MFEFEYLEVKIIVAPFSSSIESKCTKCSEIRGLHEFLVEASLMTGCNGNSKLDPFFILFVRPANATSNTYVLSRNSQQGQLSQVDESTKSTSLWCFSRVRRSQYSHLLNLLAGVLFPLAHLFYFEEQRRNVSFRPKKRVK